MALYIQFFIAIYPGTPGQLAKNLDLEKAVDLFKRAVVSQSQVELVDETVMVRAN